MYIHMAPKDRCLRGLSASLKFSERRTMQSLPASVLVTVLFSATICLSPLSEFHESRVDADTLPESPTAVAIGPNIGPQVEFSPAPSRWRSLNPQVQYSTAGSAQSSLDQVLHQDEVPPALELLDPVYLISKLLCFIFIIVLMAEVVILQLMIVWCICSYTVSCMNPMRVPKANIPTQHHALSNRNLSSSETGEYTGI